MKCEYSYYQWNLVQSEGFVQRLGEGRIITTRGYEMSGFGERLRRLRGNRSQKEVAGLLGMPITTYSTLENQDSLPRGPVLKKLADFFAVQMSYFHPTPSPALRSTESARGWLESLRSSEYTQQKTAAHADFDIADSVKSKIADKIKELNDKAANQH